MKYNQSKTQYGKQFMDLQWYDNICPLDNICKTFICVILRSNPYVYYDFGKM